MSQDNADSTTVRLVISSEIKLVDLVHSAAERVAEMAGFDADEALNIGLAVREAVINAIVHGNGGNAALDVDVTLRANAKNLTASIRDRGNGFDPSATPDPTQGDNLLATSGRGLLLIRAFVDEVEFVKHDDNGTEVKLTKKIESN